MNSPHEVARSAHDSAGTPSPSDDPRRIVVLVSGGGTNLQALLDATDKPSYGAVVVAVGADRDGIAALERASSRGVPTFVRRVEDFASRDEWDASFADAVAAHDPDLVVSAGFMRVAGAAFLARFGGRFLNTHPALLPAFPGMHGARDALAYGVRVTGATVFVVDAGVDTGPIAAQVAVPVRDDDDESSLHERIKVEERAMLVDVVGRMAREGWTVTGRKVTIGVSTPHEVARSAHDSAGTPSTPHEVARSAHDSAGTPTTPHEVARSAHDSAGTPSTRPVRRALVSVYDKTGLDELARGLHEAGVALVSTGSTAAHITAAGVPVTSVEELTGFPECLDGRVKTLHPRVHAGILADLRLETHRAQLHELGIEPFDLVVVNLYPFSATVESGASPDDCVEQIDIGGPSMVRAAAKNHPSVAVVVDPGRYPDVLAAVAAGGFTLDQRRRLAAEAFAHTATYDTTVASWFAQELVADTDGWPQFAGFSLTRSAVLRYGENPHQRAALYRTAEGSMGLAGAEQLHGKEMSYNNYVDVEAALRAAHDFEQPCVAIVKHTNPCGIAVADDVAIAHARANACDPVSAFGGVIAANRIVTTAMAEQVAEVFAEVIAAPGFEPRALEVLTRKKSVRVLVVPGYGHAPVEWRQICGGVLAQQADRLSSPGDDPAAWTLAAGPAADDALLRSLEFAWRAVRAVKSNAILLATDGATVGVGMGQVNRVDSARLAVSRAGERASGSVAASDAFFPFADGLQVLIDAGVRAVVQPGGSVRDDEVVAVATAAGLTLYLTGTRHFLH